MKGPQKENCANLEGIFRIIQSIPSKKAEPFKRWMAEKRIGHSVISPDKAIDHLQSPEELPFNKVDEQ